MSNTFLAACVQTNATDDVDRNLQQIERLVEMAFEQKADLIALPEACDYQGASSSDTRQYARAPSEHGALKKITELAIRYRRHLLVGSLTVESESGQLANRSYMLSPDGKILAQYDKIHMFDANIAAMGGSKESDVYNAGKTAQLVDLPWGRCGMTICYDLRFPHLYRGLAHRGASILTVPSAFTVETGRAHWVTLLQARAIENTCFVIAPAQTGHHYDQRYSFGHSLIVSPWGEILAEAGSDVGVISATIDMEKVEWARSKISSLNHDRDIGWPRE